MAQDSSAFLAQYMHVPMAIVAPEIGVRQGYAMPFVPDLSALVPQAQPQHGTVPTAPTISDRTREQLAAPTTGFFQNVMRPTIKHV